MPFQPGEQPEPRFTQADKDRIWELFFGKRWGLNHIAREYQCDARQIAAVIDSESERKWREQHPHEVNRVRLQE